MLKTQPIDLVRYEYIVYFYIREICRIKEILLTKDDILDIDLPCNHIRWTPALNINIDSIDLTEGVENGEDMTPVKSRNRNRICGLFDAEPHDWKYARIIVECQANTKCIITVAKMPRSPIIPVIFEIKQ